MTQVVYGSWVEVSAETARSMSVRSGDVLRVESPHGSLEAPAYVSDAFCASRLGDAGDPGPAGLAFGTLPRGLDTRAVVARATPALPA